MDENLMPQGAQMNAGTLAMISLAFTFGCCKLTTNLFPVDRNVESCRFRIFSGGGPLSSCTSIGDDAESSRISSSQFDSVS